MSNANGGTIVVRVEGRDVGLSDLLSRINSQMNQSGSTVRNYATAMAQIDPTLRRAETELARYAQSLANVALKSGDTTGATRILSQALTQITPATTAANQVQSQLQGILNTQASSAARTGLSLTNLAGGLFILRGAFQAAIGVAQTFAEVINQGNQLEKTLVTFRVLSGNQEQYEKNLAAARAQQERFGGSLQDTVEGMASFAVLARNTGIEIEELTNLARAMAIIDPVQGFKGAGIALKEFFSGDITSLARRFEIPRDSLNNIKNIADEAERFAALQEVLAQYGITTELLGAQAGATATAYEKLSGNAADAKAALGQLLAEIGKPFAEQFAASIRQTTEGIQNLRLFLDQSSQAIVLNQKVFSSTEGYDAYRAKLEQINAQIPFYMQSIEVLTPAQYAFVQALTATGLSAEQAFTRITQTADSFEIINAALQRGQLVSGATAETMAVLAQEIGNTASISANAQGFVEGLAIAVAQGLPPEQAMIALHQFRAAELANVAAANAAATKEQENQNAALNEGAIEALNTANASGQLKARQEALMAVINALANGTISQANAESILANQYGVTAAQLPGLINLTYQLAAARQAEIAASNALNRAQVAQTIEQNRAAGRIGRGDSSDYAEMDAAARRANEEKQKALDAQIVATGTAAQQRELYNRKLRESVAMYGANSAAAINAQTALDRFEASQAKAAARGASGGTAPKLTANEKLGNQLLTSQDKFNQRFEDAEAEHYDRLADIYEEYNEKVQEQMAQNEVSKRRSRADFYSGLADAEGIDVGQFAAQYEQAFAEAQQIAQSGKARLAQEFLDLRTRQIEEMRELEEEAAQIRADRAEGKISEDEAAAQLEFLEGRKRLIEEAQAEERKLLLEGGDQYQNELNEKLTEEERRYEEQTAKIATQAERTADAKVTAAERSRIAVSEENRELAEQANLYDRIAAKNGGQVPARSRIPATGTVPPTSADNTAEQAVNVEATSPIPVSSAEALLVRQVEAFFVRDTDVFNAIGDMASRLEGRLGEVVAAVNGAKDSITGAVSAVENAVGRIRMNTGTGVVQT